MEELSSFRGFLFIFCLDTKNEAKKVKAVEILLEAHSIR